ncbi:FMN-linked oxidoreductase [Pluteus cervinus]|uniref:FMN-linked oxidoreductase n=1 Tax=Pluteus cervinus TaxID=181527 RepID=A0ACD3B8T4_9AGAR|nr:FMN-linked oxidoreductase [Pluteus cervinus]
MTTPSNLNVPAKDIPYFTPAQIPPAGTAAESHRDEKTFPSLFHPLKIRGLEFQNRIFVSPMCQYSSENGKMTPWHLAHLGGIFTRGPGLTVVEATAVVPEGRISPEDAGLWSDDQIESHAQVVAFAHSQGQKIGIQLSHAGRKASTVAPWIEGSHLASEDVGGWPDDVWAPSAIAYSSTYPQPKELSLEGIQRVVKAFEDATIRAIKAGYDVIEIHAAHGYLLHQFLSPATNKRTDEYGGSFDSQVKLTLEVVDVIRRVIPADMPLFLRISATDWLEESLPNESSWRSEDTVKLAPILFAHGVDFLDVSTAGLHSSQKIKGGPAYQAPFAEAVKKSLDPSLHSQFFVGSVGAISEARVAQGVLDKGQADVVFVGRQFLKEPGLVWKFAEELGVNIAAAKQMGWPFKGRAKRTVARKA